MSNYQGQGKLVQAIAFLTPIWQMPNSNPSWRTGHPD